MKSRIKKDDATVPYFKNGYYYYVRYEKGKEYLLFCSKKGSLEAPEKVLLDVNLLAEGQEYYSVSSLKVSPSRRYLAFSVDTVGRRKYDIHFKDLKTGKILKTKISQVTGNFEWSNSSRYLFYTQQDGKTLRWDTVFRFDLKKNKKKKIFFESDDKFYVSIDKSRTNKYIFITTESSMTSEVHYLRAGRPKGKVKLFAKRRPGVEYAVEHAGDRFLITTNWKAQNFRLMMAKGKKTKAKYWKEVIPHRKDTLLEGVMAFKNKVALLQRKQGLRNIALMDRATGGLEKIKAPDPSYYISFGANPNYKTDFIRYNYESLNRPDSVFDYNWQTGKTKLQKEQEVLGDFNRENYVSERVFVSAHDGVQIPVSIVYKKGFSKNGKSPALIYGYGSYGYSMEPYFSSARLSLLDRGFVYAIAHIRGGSEMGRHWYENGKFEYKKNTFKDFISVSEYLVNEKYTSSDRLFAQGGSAGGLLMGAVANMRPDLYKGVVAQVPFVDVLTTMLDDSLPLTTNEYEEWGNPNQRKYYDYMKSYSPYDNIKKQAYPHMLILTGYHDSQVQYWEPAKWVAKLRDYTTSEAPIVFKTNMDAGHSGTTGRFRKLEEVALIYAYIIKKGP